MPGISSLIGGDGLGQALSQQDLTTYGGKDCDWEQILAPKMARALCANAEAL